eukprot:6659825-Ditylum_brightwellii.AAC.1
MAKDAIDEINSIKKQELEDKRRQQQGEKGESNDRGKQDDESNLMYTPCHVLDIGGGYPGYDGVGGDIQRFCGGGCFDDFFDGNNGTVSGQRKDESEGGEEEETASKIAQVVTPLLDKLFPLNLQDNDNQTPSLSSLNIISEPGRYFVEAAFALCSRIYSVRLEEGDFDNGRRQRRHYYIAQGVHGVFKDALLCDESFVPIPLRIGDEDDDDYVELNDNDTFPVATHTTSEEELYHSTVHGPSGEVFDVVCPDCQLPGLNVGDWLIFDRMGAYTLSIAARGGRLPIRYVVGRDVCL